MFLPLLIVLVLLVIGIGAFLFGDSIHRISGPMGMIALAGPLIFAVVGETLTEKAGIINLSLNGTILLAAMSSFVIATDSNNLFLGFLTGGLVGMFVALIVAFSSISLKLSQVAIGFVLSVLCANLAYFVGNPFPT